MIKIMFVCHGNICRSTMAEAIARDIIEKRNLKDKISVASSATSTEEIGNSPDRRTMNVLDKNGFDSKRLLRFKLARQLESDEYDDWDYFFIMDDNNFRNINRIFKDDENKVYKIFEFAKGEDKNVADPWYSGDFDKTYEELKECVELIFDKILKEC